MIRNIAAYRFVSIGDPGSLAARLRSLAEAGGLKGSVLVAEEGLNLFLAGEAVAVDGFVSALREDARFADMPVKASDSAHVPFARLKVKVKREIIAFRRADASPLGARAPVVSPEALLRWIARGSDDDGRRLVLLDTRNREETAHGAFAGALTLPIDNFTDLPGALAAHRSALEDATVVSYCTGGIRCEKAALWMRAQGLDNVLQLDGGILGYFERVGGQGYDGRCFVFDERVALDEELRPLVDAPVAAMDPAATGGSPPERRIESGSAWASLSLDGVAPAVAQLDRVAQEDRSGPRPSPGRRALSTARTSPQSAQPSRRAQPSALSPQPSRHTRTTRGAAP